MRQTLLDCFQAYDLQGLQENVNYQAAKKFVTSEQAADIFNESTMSPLSDGIKHGYAQYAVQLLRGFFPDIEIFLDWQHLSPNVYSFVLFDKKFVVLSGGLARVQGFGGGNLPACAGGKEYPDLSLQLAEATLQQVELTFNLELNQEIALEEEHYQIIGADVKEVEVDEKEPFRVRLKTELTEGSSYLLKLDGLVSVYGTELDVKSCEIEITVKQ